MKKIFILFAIATMTIVACQQTPKVVPVDIQAEEAILNGLMDKIEAGFEAGEDTTLIAYVAEDALFCGTDPSEFWTKQEFFAPAEQDSASAGMEFKNISDRVVKVAPDGNSAIVVTQFTITWSPKLPLRVVYHFSKTNDNWMIEFFNAAFIAKNEDIQKLNEALE
jgi:hypothetical protein